MTLTASSHSVVAAARAGQFVFAVGAYLVLAHVSFAQTATDCTNALFEQRKTARADSERQMRDCAGDRQCLATARASQSQAMKKIDEETSACRAHARAATPSEPPPYANWKPGDPPPLAKDGRRYIMSCNGKVLGMYKPGGAMELELKTRPGNCMPVDNWGKIGPGGPSHSPICDSSLGGPALQACQNGASSSSYRQMPNHW